MPDEEDDEFAGLAEALSKLDWEEPQLPHLPLRLSRDARELIEAQAIIEALKSSIEALEQTNAILREQLEAALGDKTGAEARAMTNDKVNEVLQKYIGMFGAIAIEASRLPPDSLRPNATAMMRHALWMCHEALVMPPEKIEKKMRWLGFIQGILFGVHFRTVEEMKRDNAPDEEKT